jgi:hypothetical protein
MRGSEYLSVPVNQKSRKTKLRYFNFRNVALAVLVIVLAFVLLSAVGCTSADHATQAQTQDGHQQSQPESNTGEGAIYITPVEGTVIVQTIYGEIKQVVRSQGGGITVNPFTTWGDDYYTVSLRPATDDFVVGSSAQNAPFHMTIRVTDKVIDNDENIKGYLKEFGLDAASRAAQRKSRIEGNLNTKLKEVVQKYDAYELLANVPTIQTDLTVALKPLMAQVHRELVAVEIMGLPDFVDDRIDNAASAVVAAQKDKEAETARLEAAKVSNERKALEAQAYANPQYREIELMKLQVEYARAWAAHNGTLVLGSTPSGTKLDIK